MIKMHSVAMLNLTLLTIIVVVESSRVKGPPVADRREERHVARVGEEVKLKCPIRGHPPPWSPGPGMER